MDIYYFKTLLEIANIFITLFILIFAGVFLKKTEAKDARKPWFFLFLAILVFLAFEVLKMLGFFTGGLYPELADLLKIVFISLVLYVFVYQYYLLQSAGKIIIKERVVMKDAAPKKRR